MRLIKIWEADKDRVFYLYKCFLKNENGFENPVFDIKKEDFDAFLIKRKNNSMGIDLKEGYVEDTVYVLEDNDNYVGIFNLCHRLNKTLENGAGHIGYGIVPKYRNMDYATKGLALVLKEAKKFGIDEAHLSVLKTNKASLNVQLNNGAYIDHEDENHFYTRIKL